jgi:hypothetical protein
MYNVFSHFDYLSMALPWTFLTWSSNYCPSYFNISGNELTCEIKDKDEPGEVHHECSTLNFSRFKFKVYDRMKKCGFWLGLCVLEPTQIKKMLSVWSTDLTIDYWGPDETNEVNKEFSELEEDQVIELQVDKINRTVKVFVNDIDIGFTGLGIDLSKPLHPFIGSGGWFCGGFISAE